MRGPDQSGSACELARAALDRADRVSGGLPAD
jgi:hypothetical protein